MKKIKFIRANKTKFGGAEVYLTRLAQELEKRDFDFELVHSNISKSLPSWVRVLLFNNKVCKEKKDSFYFSLERISCPDIYRAGDGVHKVYISIEKKSKLNLLHKVYMSIEKKCFENSKKIIANSNMIKNQIIQTYDIDPKKIEVIYNGIKLIQPNFQYSLKKMKKEFDISEDDKIILYVGSGFKRKGVREFLHIFSKLEDKSVKAFIIGKEKKIYEYEQLARELEIFHRIVFTGPRTDVIDFYAISDIFLFPTKYEPFSNVVLEAMNYSNVVITTKQNGASEILDGELIMEDKDDMSIVSKIDLLLDDNDKLNAIKKKNYDLVQQFSIENNVEKTLKVINEVIN